jgi:hypothetical protein
MLVLCLQATEDFTRLPRLLSDAALPRSCIVPLESPDPFQLGLEGRE